MTKSTAHRTFTGIAAVIAALAMVFALLAGCSPVKGAEAKVRDELESMRYVELDPEVNAEIEGMLSDEGIEYYEMFLGKAGEFDYEITGSEESGDATVVHVRITTFDFASEYLRSWTEFLEEAEKNKTGEQAEYDTGKLYETMFRNMSVIRKKDYIAYADVTCTQDENGEWQTDARTNKALIDAIMGGMVSEISSLAGE